MYQYSMHGNINIWLHVPSHSILST